MFRLLLKVHEVSLRLKEEVEVQICIKKDKEGFFLPHKSKLLKGKAIFDAHTEFFIANDDPRFQIHVMVVYGTLKKFAGMCSVDLSFWEQNSNNNTSSILQKSPDSRATIQFDFIFMTTDMASHRKSLLSLGQFQYEKKNQFIKRIEKKNSDLLIENSRLTNEVEILRKANLELTQNQHEMEIESEKDTEKFEDKLSQPATMSRDEAEENFYRVQSQMNQILEVVNDYGEEKLKERVSGIFNHQFRK